MKNKVLKTIILGTIIGMLVSFSVTIIGALIGLLVGVEDDPSRYEYKIGFAAGSAYWITFIAYMFYKGIFETKKEINENT
jgi:hypothetical protein